MHDPACTGKGSKDHDLWKTYKWLLPTGNRWGGFVEMADVIITALIDDLQVFPMEQKAIEHKLCADLAHLRGCEHTFQFALQIV